MRTPLFGLMVTVSLAACGAETSSLRPIFIEGRAVESVGDTMVAVTHQGTPGLLVRHLRTRTVDTLGAAVLRSPFHVQWMNGRWYVSDVETGRPMIVILQRDGQLERRIDLGDVTGTAHQFAVLPNGHIVVPARDRRLVELEDDTVTTFALTESDMRHGIVVAASGGVLHAVPDHTITLYNEFGNIRWRIDWPWLETAYVTDIAVDMRGRPHVIAGIPSEGGTFIVYSLTRETGEVWRWSDQLPVATFVVSALGEVVPDSASNWIGP